MNKYKTINYKGNEFRIYKWENKQFMDFKIPKQFDLAEYSDFIELINDKKIRLRKYPLFYYVKNSKGSSDIKIKKSIRGIYLYWYIHIYRGVGNLTYLDERGRIVIERKLKEKINEL